MILWLASAVWAAPIEDPDREVVRAVVQACYLEQIAATRDFTGKLAVEITADPRAAEILEDTTRRPEMATCVTTAALKTTAGAGTYAFDLRPWQGVLDPQLAELGPIRSVVRANAGQVRPCFDSALERDPEIAGRLIVEWTLSGGAVKALRLVSNNTGDAALGRCVLRGVKPWRFTGAGDGVVRMPFELAVEGDTTL